MTKSLILLRHAKSSWDHPGLNDFDRPLNRRGERGALLVGQYLQQEGVVPDLVLCSAARRTLQTWDIIRPFLPPDIGVRTTPAIYEADVGVLFDTLSCAGDKAGSILMIGHNPGLERLTLTLCGGNGGEDLDRLRQKFPTGALAFIQLNIAVWSELAPGTGNLKRFVTPKDLV